MKTKEELNALREEVDNLNAQLKELTESEMEQVIGGIAIKSPKLISPLLRLNNAEPGSERIGVPPEALINSVPHNLIITADGSEFGA